MSMYVRLVSKHDEEMVLSYSVASALISKKPISTYLAAQLQLIDQTTTDFLTAKGRSKENETAFENERKELFKELLASQTIFVPFDVRIIRLMSIFMDHEVQVPSSRHRVPKSLPKPMPTIKNFDSFVPSWHVNFLRERVMGGDEQKLGDLQELLSCADFMGVRSLVRLCSAKVASMMQACQKVDQVRDLLGINGDLTPNISTKLAIGVIGLWDTQDEQKERNKMKKKQDDADEAIRELINLTMAESHGGGSNGGGGLLQQSFQKNNQSTLSIIQAQHQQQIGPGMNLRNSQGLSSSFGNISVFKDKVPNRNSYGTNQHRLAIQDRSVHSSASLVYQNQNRSYLSQFKTQQSQAVRGANHQRAMMLQSSSMSNGSYIKPNNDMAPQVKSLLMQTPMRDDQPVGAITHESSDLTEPKIPKQNRVQTEKLPREAKSKFKTTSNDYPSNAAKQLAGVLNQNERARAAAQRNNRQTADAANFENQPKKQMHGGRDHSALKSGGQLLEPERDEN